MDLNSIRFEILTDLPGPYFRETNRTSKPVADQFPLQSRNFLTDKNSPAITTVRATKKRQEPHFVGRQAATFG